jgi:hypothetical protein
MVAYPLSYYLEIDYKYLSQKWFGRPFLIY